MKARKSFMRNDTSLYTSSTALMKFTTLFAIRVSAHNANVVGYFLYACACKFAPPPSLAPSAFLFRDYESMFDGVWEKATIVGVEMRSGRIVIDHTCLCVYSKFTYAKLCKLYVICKIVSSIWDTDYNT